MDSIGDRLRMERERLGLTQDEFGDFGGVKRNAQKNYENGSRSPDAVYLAAIAKIGVDVSFLLTGEPRTGAVLHPPREYLQDFSEILFDVQEAAENQGKSEIFSIAYKVHLRMQSKCDRERGHTPRSKKVVNESK